MTAPEASLTWLDGPADLDELSIHDIHGVVAAVVERGGAVGWLEVPGPDDVEAWLTRWWSDAGPGRARLLLLRARGHLEALGGWHAGPPGPVGHVVSLTKIMTRPGSTGRGHGRLVVEALCADATAHGAEVLDLGVRGNNQGAIALYASCGFEVWGVLPDGVAVGEDRWDDVRMYRTVGVPATAVRHGTTPGGLGGSHARTVDP